MKSIVLIVAALAVLPGQKLLVYPADLGGMEGAVLVDVRPKELFEKGHIPGAVNLYAMTLSAGTGLDGGPIKPLDALRAAVAQAGIDPNRQVVVYGSAARPEDVRQTTRVFWVLDYLGFPSVALLDGGYEGWAQGSTEPETGESRLVIAPPPEILTPPAGSSSPLEPQA